VTTTEDRPGELVVGDQVGPQWIDGGVRFWYAVSTGAGRRFVLTDDELDHVVTVSPGQECFLDSASTVDTPPVTTVRDWSGRVLAEMFA
jgi:hypothetical protein